MKHPFLFGIPCVLLASFALHTPAHAVPTPITDFDILNHCDVLDIPILVDEIGLSLFAGGTFPADEGLDSSDTPGGPAPCPDFNEVEPEVTVSITNLSGTDWRHVWYVADQGTLLTNFDGVVLPTGAPAFKIDAVGLNTPLIFESIATDGIWADGEVWEFVIQDYENSFGLAASDFDTIGIDSGGAGSSGSIVAFVPEPSRVLLLGLGVLGMILKRRRG